jgi:hypothetical protein
MTNCFHKIFNKPFDQTREEKFNLVNNKCNNIKTFNNYQKIPAQFKIPMHKYLYTFIEPNNPLYKLRLVDVFINEEMLFLTNVILCFIYTRIKQSNVQNQDPFTFKM